MKDHPELAPKNPFSLGVIASPTEAIDPVCGMTVNPASARGGSHDYNGTTYYFCAESCRRRFAGDPQQYLATPANGGHSHDDAKKAMPGKSTAYICPMDPEVISDRPGSCPKCGMALEPATPTADDSPDPELQSMTWRLWLGVALGGPLMVAAMLDMLLPGMPLSHAVGHTQFLLLQLLFCTPVVCVCGWPFFERCVQSLRNRSPNMFTLIGLGVGVAFVWSVFSIIARIAGWGEFEAYFESAAVIVVLVLAGQVLELRARRKTGDAVRELGKLTPRTARVIATDGHEEDIPVELLKDGDRIRLRPGERIPVDGTISEGSTTVDESMLTGEPVPVTKNMSDEVMTGTLNGSGSVIVQATRVGNETVLARIINLVAETQRGRMPIQRLVDRVAAWFVPSVLVAAVLTVAGWWLLGTGTERIAAGVAAGVSVLVIACPCALGLATPMAVVVGTGRAARTGILFREAAALETLARIDTVVFDKTGTLTVGKPKVQVVEGQNSTSANELLTIAASLERASEHPLGAAIVAEAQERGIEPSPASDVQTVPGKGIRGKVANTEVLVGSSSLLQEAAVEGELPTARINELREMGHTVVLIASGGQYVGLISAADPIRSTSREAVRLLRENGVRLVLLTGDSDRTARYVAKELGIQEVFADTLPAEKHAVIARLQGEGRSVAMCGDGINDAPSLAAADVGIAMGTGTDVAIAAAEVTLVQPDPLRVHTARELSRATVRTIRQNLFLAFVYNIVAVPVAAGIPAPLGVGMLGPVWAAAAMSLSSLSVIGNSLRLRSGNDHATMHQTTPAATTAA